MNQLGEFMELVRREIIRSSYERLKYEILDSGYPLY